MCNNNWQTSLLSNHSMAWHGVCGRTRAKKMFVKKLSTVQYMSSSATTIESKTQSHFDSTKLLLCDTNPTRVWLSSKAREGVGAGDGGDELAASLGGVVEGASQEDTLSLRHTAPG